MDNARKNILQTVDNIARLQDTITASTKQMLKNLAQYPEVQNGNVTACEKLFQAVLRNSLYHDNVFATGQDGTVFAAGAGTTAFNLADREYFQRAKAARDFVAGEYVVARSSNVPSFPFAFPVINDLNQLQGNACRLGAIGHYMRIFCTRWNFPKGLWWKSKIGTESVSAAFFNPTWRLQMRLESRCRAGSGR